MEQSFKDIYNVTHALYVAWATYPKNKPLYLHRDVLSQYCDPEESLERLERQHGVIEVFAKPFDNEFKGMDGLSAVEIARRKFGTVTPESKALIDKTAFSYGILVKDELESFYYGLCTKLMNLGWMVSVEAAEPLSSSDIESAAATMPSKPATPIQKINVHTLWPEHYNKRTGVLMLSPTDRVMIAKRGKATRKNGEKYEQCRLLECVFKNVNTMRSGVKISKILVVSDSILTSTHDHRIQNTIDEINRKVIEAGGPPNLIKKQKQKVFINSSYL